MKITEKQICEDQIVTFKQSHNLYQGLLFLNTINMCDRGRRITHMQIPRFHTQVWYNKMDPVSIVEDRERTWFHLQIDGQMNKQADGCRDVKPVYPTFNSIEAGV